MVNAFENRGWSAELHRTERPGHGRDLACAAARRGESCIVAMGGDGTVHDVANGILASGRDASLGVIAGGTGNDFAKLVGVDRCAPARAVDIITAGTIRRFDVGRAGEEYFCNTLGLGLGAEVARVRSGMPRLPGILSYLVPVVSAFFKYSPPDCELTGPDWRVRGKVMMVECCNGTTAGGSYRFAPNADPTDGYLDVCVVRQVSLLRFCTAVPRVMRGTHGSLPEVAIFRVASLTVRWEDGPLMLHLDGELRLWENGECVVQLEPERLAVHVA